MTSLGSELGDRSLPDGAAALRVAVVCRGNVARSPLGAAALTDAARRRGDDASLTIVTAGLAAGRGHDAAPRSVRVAAKHGVDLRGHLSMNVSGIDLDAQDVVLTMTRSQRDALHGRVRPDQVFTFLELALLLDHTSPACPACRSRPQAARALAQAAARRPFVRLTDIDVDDPMGRGRRAYRRVWKQLSAAADTICGSLLGEQSAGCDECRGRDAIDHRWADA